MIKQVIKKTIDLGDGRTITIETGKLAKQADGAVEVRMGCWLPYVRPKKPVKAWISCLCK